MFTNGTYKLFYIKVSGTYFPIGCLTDNNFNESVEMLTTTTRDNTDGWTTEIPTTQSYNIDISGLIDISGSTTIVSFRDLQSYKRGRTRIEWKIENGLGDDVDYGFGYITDLSDSASIDSLLSFSANIRGYSEPLIEAGLIVYEFDVFDDVYE